ncbi:uncharacterized protein EV422DRAFT_567555 [Fimicolochytrium jonesii]|uniref:uncharacterized protein n=1 Tax=Fimicolochytrium jonesii TaxID=1396493 RepID=UPI0022FEB767|nr:uncharacterized protein EV422DRAFT_567555 [Fimicolochytrium jonesii]KAI8820660.1 hypothetical protein EV422DRAFT_567555 [Fimicolochytrium jonesii]
MGGSDRDDYEKGLRMSHFEKTIFTFLYTMCKDAEHSSIFAYFMIVVEDVQMISFSWDPEAVWGLPNVVRGIMYPLNFVEHNYKVLQVLFGLSMCVIALTHRGGFQWIWPLILLRALSTVVATALFMPFMEIFVLTTVCESNIDGGGHHLKYFPDNRCFTPEHLPIFILSVVGLAFTLPFGLFINYIYVIPRPDSKNPAAKAHGMLDVLYFVLKVVIVFVDVLIGTPGKLVVLVLANLTLIMAYLQYMPHFNKHVNNMRVALFSVSFLSSIVALAAAVQAQENHAGLAFIFICVPFGLAGGWYATEYTLKMKTARTMARLQRKLQMNEAEENKIALGAPRIRATRQNSITQSLHRAESRGMMRTAGANIDNLEKGSGKLRHSATAPNISDYDKIKQFRQGAESIEQPYAPKDPSDVLSLGGKKDPITDAATILQYHAAASRKAELPPVVFNAATDADIVCRFLRDCEITDTSRKIMVLVFEEALSQFPTNAQLSLMYTYYLACWGDDDDACLLQFAATNRCKPSLAVRFRIFMEKQDFEQHRDSADLLASQMDVASYVEFQSLERQAMSSHLASLTSMKSFWAALRADAKQVRNLGRILSLMHKSQSEASYAYEKLIKRYPKSKQILRLYAKYLITIGNSSERGAQLLDMAEEIESREAQDSEKPFRNRSPEPEPEPSSFTRGDDLASLESGTVPRKKMVSALRMESIMSEASSTGFGTTGDDKPPEEKRKSTVLATTLFRMPSETAKDVAASTRKSQASSMDSGKAMRKQRSMQGRLTDTLITRVLQVSVYVRACCLVLLGLLIANHTVSTTLFKAPESFLNTLEDATRARRGAMLAAQEIRLMTYYGHKAPDAAVWQFHHDKLSGEAGRFKTLILPILFATAKEEPTYPIIRAKSGGFNAPKDVLMHNVYTLGTLMAESMGRLLSLPNSWWTTASSIEDVDVRMWLDNALKIGDAFDSAARAGLTSYLEQSSGRNILIIALMVVAIAVIAVTAALIHLTLRQAGLKQIIVLKALARLPAKDQRRISDMLDEEVEDLSEYIADGTVKDVNLGKGKDDKRVSDILQTRLIYSGSLLLLATFAMMLFVPPLIFLHSSDTTAKLIMYSNNRRYTYQVIGYLSNELPAYDNITWAPYGVQHELTWRIFQLQRQHDVLMHGNAEVPSTNDIPELATVCRTGPICLVNSGCDGRQYNETIGFNEELVFSGIDNILDVYVDHAKQFTSASYFSYDNPDLFFLNHLEDDLADGLSKVDAVLLETAQTESHQLVTVENILLSVALVYFIGFYYITFKWIIHTAKIQLSQLATLIFWIPPEIGAASPEISKMLLTGTVEASED